MSIPAADHDGTHDFDFLHGKWNNHNRLLTSRLKDSTTWQDFEATGECHPLQGGLGNMDYFRTEHFGGITGMSMRFYNPNTRQWSIYWQDSRHKGALLPPMLGCFKDGIGIFEGPEYVDGKEVRARFIWSGISATTARWEQAFSTDDGQTWETNWIMSFTRAE